MSKWTLLDGTTDKNGFVNLSDSGKSDSKVTKVTFTITSVTKTGFTWDGKGSSVSKP